MGRVFRTELLHQARPARRSRTRGGIPVVEYRGGTTKIPRIGQGILMKQLLGILALLGLAGAAAQAQTVRQYTRPTVPPPEVLDRYNLRLAWRVYVPTDRLRDGLYSVQPLENEVLVQTISGAVVSLNLADGFTRWQARV